MEKLSPERLEEIAGKIEWEGGIVEAFLGYGLTVPELPEVMEKVAALEEAYDALEKALEEAGVLNYLEL